MLLSKYSYLSRHGLTACSATLSVPCQHVRKYSIDTPPEDLQKNVPALQENIDMKNLALSSGGGRSSVSGVRATVFGASSALGISLNDDHITFLRKCAHSPIYPHCHYEIRCFRVDDCQYDQEDTSSMHWVAWDLR